MKTLNVFYLIFALLIGGVPVYSQQKIEGAWKLVEKDGKPFKDGQMVKVFADDYFMFGWHTADGAFKAAGGGTASLQDKKYIETLDFFTLDSTRVRVPLEVNATLKGNKLTLKGSGKKQEKNEVWQKVDNSSNELSGAWRFANRVDTDGNRGERRSPGPRETIKILNGNRFQWAAFNYITKQFMGTGGGTYSLSDGKYTENIEFFSKDNSRVGASLSFDFERIKDEWHHKGLSSAGKPIYEIWEKVER
ncbi:MAG: hypothetical protein ACFCUU_18965 [Cyclobacteriaceae bacterium]